MAGYRKGQLILNLPERFFDKTQECEGIPELSKNDIVVLPTRPPLDDKNSKRHVERSSTPLEIKLLDECVRLLFLDRCSRKTVEVADAIETIFPDASEAFANAQYQVNGGANFAKKWATKNIGDNADDRTAGYLLFTPEAWPGGPRFLVLYGMSGPESVSLSYWLSTRFARQLETIVTSPDLHFAMAQWPVVAPPPRPGSFSYLDKVDVEIIVHATAKPAAGPVDLQWKATDFHSLGEQDDGEEDGPDEEKEATASA